MTAFHVEHWFSRMELSKDLGLAERFLFGKPVKLTANGLAMSRCVPPREPPAEDPTRMECVLFGTRSNVQPGIHMNGTRSIWNSVELVADRPPVPRSISRRNPPAEDPTQMGHVLFRMLAKPVTSWPHASLFIPSSDKVLSFAASHLSVNCPS